MSEQSTSLLRGSLKMALKDAKTGEILWKQEVTNTIPTRSLAWGLIAIQSGNSATTQTINQMAIGTGTTAPATADTTLVSETTRKAIGTWDNTGTTANPPYMAALVNYATDEGNTTLGEVGLFNSSSSGTLIARATYATTAKTTDNVLGMTYTLTNGTC